MTKKSITAFDDLPFGPIAPGRPVDVALLWGDPATGVDGPGSYAVQPGGAAHREINGGEGEMVAFVYFDGPIDCTPDGA